MSIKSSRTPSEACARLSRLFQSGRVRKRYLALVHGSIELAGLIDLPLVKHNGVFQSAHTAFERLHNEHGVTWLAVMPQEGRKHQIRRHFSAIGRPLVGDSQYGDCEANARFSERTGVTRLGLHAGYIGFPHPITNVDIAVEVPVPPDLAYLNSAPSQP